MRLNRASVAPEQHSWVAERLRGVLLSEFVRPYKGLEEAWTCLIRVKVEWV
jgi:hypothetical protein